MIDAARRIVDTAHRRAPPHPDPAVERVREQTAAAAWGEAMRERLHDEALQRRALAIYCAAVGVTCPAALTVSDEVM